MRMKHRWIGFTALAAVLALGGCAPTDQGADVESAAPSVSESLEAEPSASSTPYVMDEY